MSKYKIIAICGKSAAGKDTLLQDMLLRDPHLHEIISCTSRPPREGEVHGKNYFFISLDEFREKYTRGEMLEVSEFRGWAYGTSIDGLNPDAINVGVFNPEGIRGLMHNTNVDLFVVRVDASDKTRLIRSLHREKNPDVDEIVRRYLTDKSDFENFSRFYEPDFIINNDGQGINPQAIDKLTPKIVSLARDHWAEKAN